jgi:hypothetical protein
VGRRRPTAAGIGDIPEPPALSIDVAALRRRLAAEPLSGGVVMSARQPLHRASADARGATFEPGPLVAATVIADEGEVVLIETTAPEDCVPAHADGYDVKAYVARAVLVPRLAAEVARTFADETAVVLGRGTPVEVTATALRLPPPLERWAGRVFEVDQLVLGAYLPAAMPALPALSPERLMYCEAVRGAVTFDEWMSEFGKRTDGVAPDPTCVLDPAADAGGRPTRAAPRLDGMPVSWPDTPERVDRLGDARLVAQVDAACMRARIAVAAEAVRQRDGGIEGVLGDGFAHGWRVRPGQVTWPDGSPAGRFMKLADVIDRTAHQTSDGRLCFRVDPFAEPLCHAKSDYQPLR